MMLVENVERAIGTLGFPIAMCVYLVYRDNKKLEKLTEAIQELTQYIRGVNNGRRTK